MYVYRGRQRAIGELMIERVESPASGRPQSACIGDAAFVARQADPQFARWFERLGEAVTTMAERAPERLVAVQDGLVGLIDLLDPDRRRVPYGRARLTLDPATRTGTTTHRPSCPGEPYLLAPRSW